MSELLFTIKQISEAFGRGRDDSATLSEVDFTAEMVEWQIKRFERKRIEAQKLLDEADQNIETLKGYQNDNSN